MEKKNYQRTIRVNVSAEEAMKKISQVNNWWAKKFKGRAEKPGDKFTVDFGETWVEFQVIDFVPGEKISWKVTDCYLDWINNKKEWNGTEVVFEFSSAENKTKIDFTHVGLVPGIECYKDCEPGWNKHVGESLFKFIEEGKGIPV